MRISRAPDSIGPINGGHLISDEVADRRRARDRAPYQVRLLLLISLAASPALAAPAVLTYPSAKKVEQTDDYNGVTVADPYRWLEDDNSAETKAWVQAENKVTFGFLEQIPQRKALKENLTRLWNFERYG